ncbi:MAG: mycothiol synthase [Actinomycetes bacterium]
MTLPDASRAGADRTELIELLGREVPDDLLRRSARRADGLIWVTCATDDDDRCLAACGCTPARTVLQLRCSLPLPGDAGPTTATRAFRPGIDDEAFLAVNHRAFEWHPEQGALDRAGLEQRISEPWFSSEGFLIHTNEDGEIDGYCWTKVHPSTGDDPPLGEIYVIACDPSAQGRGLGRALVVAGLDHLSRAGVDGTPVRDGMLYVEDSNAAAIRLYESLGFSLHHRDAAFSVPEPNDQP